MRLAILFSGRGSNLNAILARTFFKATVEVCITDQPQAKGIEVVKHYAKPLIILEKQEQQTKADYDAALIAILQSLNIDLVVLAGFMRTLSAEFCEVFAGKCINIHPSLLPKFKGLHTHERALAQQEQEHGCSVHFVTKELDGGPLMLQAKVPVFSSDTVDTLSERVLKKEHYLLPMAIQMLAIGEILWSNNEVLFNGVPLHGRPAYEL